MTTIERHTTDAAATLRRPPRRRVRWLAGLGWVLLLLISVDVVLVVSRYLTFDPDGYFPEQREVYLRLEPVLGVHVLSGILALLAAPFQLVGALRRRFPPVHRFLGAVYIASVIALGITGLVLAPTAYTGLVAVLGFTCLDAAMLYTTWTAVRKVVAGEVEEHRRWIIRSYSLILAGVMLRLMTFTHATLTALGLTSLSFETAYAAISWLCWVPNLLLALWITRRRAGN
jgi:uncharacterized membrane protein